MRFETTAGTSIGAQRSSVTKTCGRGRNTCSTVEQTALLLGACLTLLTTEQGALFLDPLLVSCRVGKGRLALTVVAVSDVHVRASLFDRVDHGFAMETASFEKAGQVMSYTGMVPSEHSSAPRLGVAPSPRRATRIFDACSWSPLGTTGISQSFASARKSFRARCRRRLQPSPGAPNNGCIAATGTSEQE